MKEKTDHEKIDEKIKMLEKASIGTIIKIQYDNYLLKFVKINSTQWRNITANSPYFDKVVKNPQMIAVMFYDKKIILKKPDSLKFKKGDKVKYKNATEVGEILDIKNSTYSGEREVTIQYPNGDIIVESTDVLKLVKKGTGVMKPKKFYTTKKPSNLTHVIYDFARNDEQAKDMLESLATEGAIAHKSTSEGGEYNIYISRKSQIGRGMNGTPTEQLYNVVKVFRVSMRRQIIARRLTREEAKRVVASYPDSSRSMVIFQKCSPFLDDKINGVKAIKKNLKGTSEMTTKQAKPKKRKAHKTTVKKVSIAKRSTKEAGVLVNALERTVKSGKATKKAVLSTIGKIKTRVASAKKSLGTVKEL